MKPLCGKKRLLPLPTDTHTHFYNHHFTVMPNRNQQHFEASIQGRTRTGLIKTESGKSVCGVVRDRVGVPHCLQSGSPADSSETKLLEHIATW